MKRICSIFATLTIIALFNIGGCGGSDNNETNTFSPVIDRIIFYQNSDKIKQTQSYTQGSEGIIVISISDYDLNAESIDVQVNQCANESCRTLTAYHTPGVYNLTQTEANFNYTFPDMADTIKILPATFYYQFVFEVMDRDGQISVADKVIQIHTGIPPKIYDFYFYKRYPGERLDTWNSYYDFVAEFKARDLDSNAKYIYIIRTCLETTDPNHAKPVINDLGPIELDEEDTKTTEIITIDADTYVNQKTSATSLIQEMLKVDGLYEITIRLEDALGNTAEMSKSITITH
jgi:hypothetical protein